MRHICGGETVITKLPTESHDLTAVVGIPYVCAVRCSVPGCGRLAEQAHHIVRRSFLSGPVNWVRYPDGTVHGNLTGLCISHHDQITNNRSAISYKEGVFYFEQEYGPDLVLEPQPPLQEFTAVDMEAEPEPGPASVPYCASCKRPLPVKREKSEGRVRATWAVRVPNDEQENGADTLDTLLDVCRELFQHDTTHTVKYYTLAQALALVTQHGHQMVKDGPAQE